jgi:hypothetical protein
VSPDRDTARKVMRVYGVLFVITGTSFVLFPGLVLGLLRIPAAILPGAGEMAGGEASLWLGLTGSLMAVIAYLSLTLARDPGQLVAWNALILSKALSTGLFAVFAATEANTLYLTAALVDGVICIHIAWLSGSAAASSSAEDPWHPRATEHDGDGYEVWFLKLNDPATRDAFWARYTMSRGPGGAVAACWFVYFDAERRTVEQGRWEHPADEAVLDAGDTLFRLPTGSLGRRWAKGEGEGARWDLGWEPGAAPPFDFVSERLYRSGIAGSRYFSAQSEGCFRGSVEIAGTRREFRDATGSVGHIWGARMAERWRWAHAVLPDGNGGEESVVFEVLSGRPRSGGPLGVTFTLGHLWFGGRHYASTGLVRSLCSNRTKAAGDGWDFRIRFDGLVAEGHCAPAADLVAEVDYTDPAGRPLVCKNSKTGHLRLELRDAAGNSLGIFETQDTAAVETVVRVGRR